MAFDKIIDGVKGIDGVPNIDYDEMIFAWWIRK